MERPLLPSWRPVQLWEREESSGLARGQDGRGVDLAAVIDDEMVVDLVRSRRREGGIVGGKVAVLMIEMMLWLLLLLLVLVVVTSKEANWRSAKESVTTFFPLQFFSKENFIFLLYFAILSKQLLYMLIACNYYFQKTK